MTSPITEKVRGGKVSVGTWCYVGHPDVAEMLAGVGYDWIIFDMEHGAMSFETLTAMMQAMKGSATLPIIRPAGLRDEHVRPALDAGVRGVMFPMVNTADEARSLVAACRYPPRGRRGIGPRRACDYGRSFSQYLRHAEDDLFISVQVESPQAVENLDAILSVEGIDAVMLGPGDLSMLMGCFANRDEDPGYRAAVAKVIDTCRRRHVIPGIAYVGSPKKARRAIDTGFTLVGIGTDDQFLLSGAKATLDAVRNITAP